MLATSRHNKALLALLGCMLVGGVVLYLYSPESLRIPRCPFLQLTGWQCPGCGSLRGIHALLHGNIVRVLQLNVMLIPALLYLALLVMLELTRPHSVRAERLYRRFSGRIASWIIFVLIVVWGIGRNLL
ncbi:DUF2752 domain-containing protein [Porphyromonas sp.]|uniref:DUF2752 domain-containing protein n=1 Tax=Porphyromonas sp. TaxID=1924944 RepID=UPI0025F122AA|nr:DUF2752 domain-containing protein [Porphyromonas sp.]